MQRFPWGAIVLLGCAVAVIVAIVFRSETPASHPRRPAKVPLLIEPPAATPVVANKVEPPPTREKVHPVRPLDRLLGALRNGRREEILVALDALLAEIQPPPVPDEENAAVLYREAFGKTVTPTAEEEAAIESLWDGRMLSPDQQALIRAYLEKNAEALRLLHEAVLRRRCNFGLDYTQGFAIEMPHIANMIRVEKYLLKTEGLVRDGQASQESWTAAHRMANALSDEPLLISQLVRNVCDGIASGTLQHALEGEGTDASLRKLNRALDPEKSRAALQRSVLGEIYVGVKHMMDGEAGAIPDLGPFRAAHDPLWQHEALYFAETMAQFHELMGKPYYEAQQPLEILTKTRVLSAPAYAAYSSMLVPAWGRAARNQAAGEATMGTAKIAATLKLYRSANGSYPASLEDLKTLLPVDPFTGNSYVYRREGSGFVVYSAGYDGLDNGGLKEETDILFRCAK